MAYRGAALLVGLSTLLLPAICASGMPAPCGWHPHTERALVRFIEHQVDPRCIAKAHGALLKLRRLARTVVSVMAHVPPHERGAAPRTYLVTAVAELLAHPPLAERVKLRAVAILVEAYLSAGDWRGGAAEVLVSDYGYAAAWQHPQAARLRPHRPKLVAALSGTDARTRRRAVALLGILRAAEATPALLRLLVGDALADQRAAVVALGHIRAKDAVVPLISAYARWRDQNLRRECLEALGEIGDPRALPLFDAVAAGDDRVLASTARAQRRSLRQRNAKGTPR